MQQLKNQKKPPPPEVKIIGVENEELEELLGERTDSYYDDDDKIQMELIVRKCQVCPNKINRIIFVSGVPQ